MKATFGGFAPLFTGVTTASIILIIKHFKTATGIPFFSVQRKGINTLKMIKINKNNTDRKNYNIKITSKISA